MRGKFLSVHATLKLVYKNKKQALTFKSSLSGIGYDYKSKPGVSKLSRIKIRLRPIVTKTILRLNFDPKSYL